MTNLYDAHKQWIERPPDERFADIQSLYDYTRNRRMGSSEESRNLSHIHLTVTPDSGVAMNGDTPPAYLTNWAFGQLATTVGAPARYLRSLPPEIVKDCLAHGLQSSSERCKVMLRSQSLGNGSGEQFLAAAFTGPTYGRIWDSDVVENLMQAIEGTGWHVPPAHPSYSGTHSGLYASDRDMFAFFVNDENPVEVGNAKLGRGFFIWNSETGAATFGLTTFLYNYVCGNHIVWGADQIQELRIVHRHRAPDRFYNDAIPVLNRFVENRSLTESVSTRISGAMAKRIGESFDEVSMWFSHKPFTKQEITEAFGAGQLAGEDPTTLWGMIQGFTACAKWKTHANAKVDLERRAGLLLN